MPCLAEQAAVRELAALVDGPCRLRWFWRDELEALQGAARRMGHRPEHPAGIYRCYHPTQEWIEHPSEPGALGRVWRHHEPSSGPRRVLITGSRSWTHPGPIRRALGGQCGDGTAVLVSGACPRGADRIAETFWRGWGGRIERHPADWARHGRSAGYHRNTEMVALGADVCLAFIHAASPGATHTARLAEAAAIPTHRYIQPSGKDA